MAYEACDECKQIVDRGCTRFGCPKIGIQWAGNMTVRNRSDLTLRERLSMYWSRVKDAWLVLRGKADIE
jgi:hypothetical protein